MNFLQIITLTFIFLKISGAVEWSWFIVLSPVILSLAFALWMAVYSNIGDNINDREKSEKNNNEND